MLRIRLVEEAIAETYPLQEMRCPVHLSIGQEAVAAGTAAAFAPGDLAMSGHRSHAHYLAKGGDLRAMLAELMGRENGRCRGRGGSMHLIDQSVGFIGAVPIVGSTIPIAVGLAFADKLKGIQRVTAAFFGEAATEEGVFHESANFASLHRLPVVFVCENNLYSVYSPMNVRQPSHREVFQQAQGHGIPAEQVDGNDPEAVFLSAKRPGVEPLREKARHLLSIKHIDGESTAGLHLTIILDTARKGSLRHGKNATQSNFMNKNAFPRASLFHK